MLSCRILLRLSNGIGYLCRQLQKSHRQSYGVTLSCNVGYPLQSGIRLFLCQEQKIESRVELIGYSISRELSSDLDISFLSGRICLYRNKITNNTATIRAYPANISQGVFQSPIIYGVPDTSVQWT